MIRLVEKIKIDTSEIFLFPASSVSEATRFQFVRDASIYKGYIDCCIEKEYFDYYLKYNTKCYIKCFNIKNIIVNNYFLVY